MGAMERRYHTTQRSFEGAARNYNIYMYLWADLSGKICDKTFISTLHKNYSFVRRLQNCVEWYGPFGPWHPSFKNLCKFSWNKVTLSYKRIIIEIFVALQKNSRKSAWRKKIRSSYVFILTFRLSISIMSLQMVSCSWLNRCYTHNES